MNIIFYAIFVLAFTKYEARRIDNKYWINEADKEMTKAIRLAVCVMAAENVWQFPAYALLTMGLWDVLINYFTKAIKDPWYIGSTGNWFEFWQHRPLWLYKAFRYVTIIGGIVLMILSYIFGELPSYMNY